MPSAEKVRDLTIDTIDLARGRAEDLVHTGSHGLGVAAGRLAGEVRDHRATIELPALEVPPVDVLVARASSHKLRTTVMASLLLLLLVVVVRKATSSSEPEHAPAP